MGTEFQECLLKMRNSIFDEDSREVTKILLKLVSNLLIHPGEEKFRIVKPTNKTISRLVNVYADFMEYLFLVGFKPQVEANQITYVLLTSEEVPSKVETALNVLRTFAQDISLPMKNIPTIEKYNLVSPSTATSSVGAGGFDHYKSSKISTNPMPASGNGNTVMEERLDKLNAERIQKMTEAGIPERNIKVYPVMKNFNPRNFSSKRDINNDDESEAGDAMIQLAAGKKMKENISKGMTFKTKAMREMELMKKRKIYTEVVFRVHLPNRWTVEIFMSPLETFDDLLKVLIDEVFVQEVFEELREPIYFYVTPPKKVFKKDDWEKNFDQLRLAPAALIYLGFGEVDDKGRVTKERGGASVDIASLIKKDLVVVDESVKTAKVPKGQKMQVEDQKSKGKKEKAFKKPKWFKL